MGKRAIAYVRVSTTRQADNELSIPDQLTRLKAYCEQHGLTYVREYIDPGASARDDNRPQFQQMLADIKSGAVKCDLLLVHSFSRFFRDRVGFVYHQAKLAKLGVRLMSVTQPTEDSAEGDFVRDMFASFDAYQSASTGKDVQRTMLENARRGFWNGSMPPYGYVTTVTERIGNKDKKKLAIEPKEAEVVKLAFKLYLHGDGKSGPLGIKDVTSYLNERGFRNRNGNPFRVQVMQQLLRRTDYIGEHYFNKLDSRTGALRPRDEWVLMPVPRIVDDYTFHQVQAQLEMRNPKMTPPRVVNTPTLLTGVARCESCGAPMRLRTGKGGRYRYYTCSRKADQGATGCKGTTVSMPKLDGLVVEALCDKVLRPDRLTDMVATLIERNSDKRLKDRTALKELQTKRRQLEGVIDRLMDQLETCDLSEADIYRKRISRRNGDLDQIKRLIAIKERDLNAPAQAVTSDKLDSFARALRTRLADDADPKFRQAYLRLLLSEVVVGKDTVRLKGSNAVIAHQLASDKPLVPSMVPTFVEEWRAGEDSNSRPPDS
ncbi:recombinase family protein [Pyruvatibacter mobilis]|uniref:recombinase family protein n=1 Tax=Pyruvatibacter mobilis TaxID=1712261 RepID=UPI003BAA9F8C